ncbi:restriction endonuclease subunit S [Fertoebacter nigrum]|uniref:Restriction endonuclease subunit S n=1 Tax=Fertoeibacter niger TaxID=2656921 RepID=A0A8X8KLM5_9RHOB|nr:restriction endonuclease subunit S [Fertoeibacter niger]NUB42995.1 restriction endonuclease subunit S [Fertoeibacter niger]
MSWQQTTLGEIADIVSGSTPKSSVPRYWDGAVAWATPTDLSRLDGKHLYKTDRTITEAGLNECSARLLPPGSVLFSSRAPIGLVAINTTPMATNQGFKSFVPRPELNADYLYWWLRANRRQLEDLGNGATFKEVSKAIVSRVKFPLPPLTEQRRIAAILDKADAILRKREQALTLADDFLRSVFLEMFGDPGENPMNWDREPLSLQAEVKIGFPFKSAEYVEEGIRLCRGANTMPDRLEWSDTRYWPVSDAARFAEYALVSGDIILALDRPWISSGLKVAEVVQADLPALLVQRVARIRSSVPAEKPFVFQCLRHPSFWSYCNPTETTIPHISPVELKNYPMIKPPRELVAAFGMIAAKQSVLRQKVEQDAKDARQLFQSLSQRAFAGDL